MNKKLWWGVGLVVVAIVVVFASKNQQASPQTIKIGAVLPLTGIAAVPGANEQKGIELAVEEINTRGGVGGKKLEVVFEDDQTDAKTTVSAINKEISVDKVSAIIGATWDFLANAAIPVIDKAHIVLITPSALPDTLTSTSSYLFTTHSPVAINEGIFESFLGSLASKRVAIITVNNPWGQAHAAAVKKAVSATRGNLLKEVVLPNFDNNDLQRELSLVKPLNPSVFMTAMNFGDYSVFMRRVHELGFHAAILAHSNLADTFFAGNISKDLMEGAIVYKFSKPSDTFRNAFKKKYGAEPETYSDTAYDAVYAIKQAIENSGGDYDTDSIVAGLHKIKNYEGASGVIDYSINNYPANKTPVLEIFKDGKFVELK